MLRYAKNGEKAPNKEVENTDLTYDESIEKKTTTIDRLLLNRSLKVTATFVICATVLPPLLYHLLISSTLESLPSDGYSVGSCFIDIGRRIPCGKLNVTESECHSHCCYDAEHFKCYHRLPSRFSYILDKEWNEDIFLQPRISNVPYALQTSISNLGLSFDEISSSHLSLTIYDPSKYEPQPNRITTKDYTYEVSAPEMDVVIKRDNVDIFKSDRGPLIASNNIWEWSFILTDEDMYGLGEIPLKGRTKHVIYSYDENSIVPLIYARKDEKFHGVFIEVTTLTEIEILPSNHVIVRAVADDHFKFHVFSGPSPHDIAKEVSLLFGAEPNIEYWQLGYHFCSEMKTTPANSYAHLQRLLLAAEEDGIPFDSHCGVWPIELNSPTLYENIDVVENGLQLLDEHQKKFVPHLSPYVVHNGTFNHIIESDRLREVFLKKHGNDDPYIGLANNDDVLYPDYAHDETQYLIDELWPKEMYRGDSIILENNWPLDDSVKDFSHMNFPYLSQEMKIPLLQTLNWNVEQCNNIDACRKQIYIHNKYGNDHVQRISQLNQRQLLFSSSQNLENKAAFNRQNLDASWSNLRKELTHIALAGISGIQKWVTPICGDTEHFNLDNQRELCTKWYLTAAFMPLVKVHSKISQREPHFFDGMYKVYIIESMKTRYTLLPYLYTVLADGPILRPMFYQYPDEAYLHDASNIFSVGDSLLIAPNLVPDQSWINIKLPSGNWYELWSGVSIEGGADEHVTIPTTLADLVVLVRGGSIIPIQEEVQLTASSTRLSSPYTLVLALATEQNSTEIWAKGTLRLHENLRIHFEANKDMLTVYKASDEHLDMVCNDESGLSSTLIEALKLFGISDGNNNDTYRRMSIRVDICDLNYQNITVALNISF